MNKKLFNQLSVKVFKQSYFSHNNFNIFIIWLQGYVMYVTKICKMSFEDQLSVAEIVLGPHPEQICKHSLS